MNITDDSKRLKLINLLDDYIRKPRILMRPVMIYYKNLLMEGRPLKVRYFNQLIPYLRIDMRMNEKYLRNYFSPLIGNSKYKSTPKDTNTVSLEDFFQ